MKLQVYYALGALTLRGYPTTQSFSPRRSFISKSSYKTTTHQNNNVIVLRESSDDGSGGTEWIKKSMGSDEGDGSTNNSGASPSPPISPNFTKEEIEDMNKVILSLSKETDDEKRRERLAGLFDSELAYDKNTDAEVDTNESPRFAQLFQTSLDIVGQEIQTAAREAAEKQLQQDQWREQDTDDAEKDLFKEIEATEKKRVERVKSSEELQLWALIDMMIQSKTRVANIRRTIDKSINKD